MLTKKWILISIGSTLLLGICFFLMQIFLEYQYALAADLPIPPNLEAHSGSLTLERWGKKIELISPASIPLEISDTISTDGAGLATITWPDHSITRLSHDTTIQIREMSASETYQDIKIRFDALRGKIWNTVIRGFVGESAFEVTLPREQVVAAVRWTTFEINLDTNYIHSVDHAIILSDAKNRIKALLPEEIVSTMDISTLLSREILNTGWIELNKNLDSLYTLFRTDHISLLLSKDKNAYNRWIYEGLETLLSEVKGYEALKIERSDYHLSSEELRDLSPEALTTLYQRLRSIKIEPDTLITTLSEQTDPLSRLYLPTLQETAFYRELSSTGNQEKLRSYLEDTKKWLDTQIESLRKLRLRPDWKEQIRWDLPDSFIP